MVVLVQNLGPVDVGYFVFYPEYLMLLDPIWFYFRQHSICLGKSGGIMFFYRSLIMGISFIIMWQLYAVNGVNYNFVYFLLWSFI
jgi:GPH family glycoside/pentoside/hexuronide:cation symporter